MKQNVFEKGISTGYYCPLSPEESVLELIKHGFSSAEMSYEHAVMLLDRCGGSWMKKAYTFGIGDKTSPDGKTPTDIGKEFGEFLKQNNFSIPQAHLYYMIDNADKRAIEVHLRWIELYVAMGVKNLVIHAARKVGIPPEDEDRRNVVANLAEIVKGLDGTDAYLCIENTTYGLTYSVDQILKIIEDAGNSEHFAVCLDTGHLNMHLNKGFTTQTHREYILKAGSKLRALHIANNDGSADMHCLPYNLKAGAGRLVDWQEVVEALKEIGYKHLFNFEVPGECVAPKAVKDLKIEYITKLADYMLTEL